MRLFRNVLGLAVVLLGTTHGAWAVDIASGTVAMGTTKVSIRHAWMVRGPDERDPQQTVLRIYLSSTDIGARIKACATIACADAALEDGAMVDFGDASHLAYAVRLNGARIQYSGGTDAEAFTLSTRTSDHLTGSLHIDDTGRGGAQVIADFDLALSRSFTSEP